MRKHSSYGWVAVVAMALFVADLASVHFLGSMQSPKVVMDRFHDLSVEEPDALMESPVQRARSFLMPLWRHNGLILPGLVGVSVGFLALWRREVSRQAVQGDGPASRRSAP
jgi:hypothetical protein